MRKSKCCDVMKRAKHTNRRVHTTTRAVGPKLHSIDVFLSADIVQRCGRSSGLRIETTQETNDHGRSGDAARCHATHSPLRYPTCAVKAEACASRRRKWRSNGSPGIRTCAVGMIRFSRGLTPASSASSQTGRPGVGCRAQSLARTRGRLVQGMT